MNDTLARPWVLTVIGIFVLVLVLSVLGVPSRSAGCDADPHPIGSLVGIPETIGIRGSRPVPQRRPPSRRYRWRASVRRSEWSRGALRIG